MHSAKRGEIGCGRRPSAPTSVPCAAKPCAMCRLPSCHGSGSAREQQRRVRPCVRVSGEPRARFLVGRPSHKQRAGSASLRPFVIWGTFDTPTASIQVNIRRNSLQNFLPKEAEVPCAGNKCAFLLAEENLAGYGCGGHVLAAFCSRDVPWNRRGKGNGPFRCCFPGFWEYVEQPQAPTKRYGC